MSDLDWIMNRKSIRDYLEKPVPEDILLKLVRAGMAAPSAVNQQLWEFIVVDEQVVLRQLGLELPYAKMLLKAPSAIVVCGNIEKAFDGKIGSPYWIMDCSAASENILLAAEILGLAAVWTAVYPDQKRVSGVKQILALPDTIMPLNVIPVGYPAKDEKPRDKWNPEAVHRNQW